MLLSITYKTVPAPRIKDKLLKLPMPQKMIGVGALLALIGSFLPWYKDIDSFNTGDQFLGITGPLYLVGYIIIGLSIFSLILTSFYFFEKNIPSLPIKESLIYILSGAFTLFLVIVANSVYFHPKFGINITSKEHQIGILLALIGSIGITTGGFLQNRESGTLRFIKQFREETGINEEKIDPVLELNNFQKEQQKEFHGPQRTHEEINSTIHRVKKEPVSAKVSELNKDNFSQRQKSSSGVREYKSRPGNSEETSVRSEPYPQLDKIKRESHPPGGDRPVNPNSVIRTDL